jgi:spermidine synthase
MMDIIIDDGYHVFEANKIFFESSIKHLAPDGIFVIEDIQARFFDEFHHQVQEWKNMFPHLNFKLVQLQFEPFKIDNNNLLVISSRPLDNL